MTGKKRIIAAIAAAALALGAAATATLAWAEGDAPAAAAGDGRPRVAEALSTAAGKLGGPHAARPRPGDAAREAARQWEAAAEQAIAAAEQARRNAEGQAGIEEAARAAAAAESEPASAAGSEGAGSPSADEGASEPTASGTTASAGEGSAPSPSEPRKRPQAAAAPETPREEPSSPAAPDPSAAESSDRLAPRTLVVAGAAVPYRDVRGGTTPDAGAGLWLGSDSTSDDSWGYFVGHNPGSFAPVKELGIGSQVTVCDSGGATRAYTVRDVFTVEATATWKTIASRVTGYGESVILQTCTGDGATNTIAVAA